MIYDRLPPSDPVSFRLYKPVYPPRVPIDCLFFLSSLFKQVNPQSLPVSLALSPKDADPLNTHGLQLALKWTLNLPPLYI